MSQFGLTSLVMNTAYAKQLGVPPFYYRKRNCNTNLTGFTPADQYQKLKQIQNTVRVPQSLYTMNLAALTTYQTPIANPSQNLYGVCWNQMSDQAIPSVQKTTVPTGFGNSLNRKHTSVTSSKPGSQTPGGAGCDIKHNSYDRYLNRLKGKGALRRGKVPNDFGKPIAFNPAYPIYGGKTIKTSIVNGCNCPPETTKQQDQQIYDNPLWQPYPSSQYGFNIGDSVYAIQEGNDFYTHAVVINVIDGVYTIQFDNSTIQTVTNVNDLLIYFPCNCQGTQNSLKFANGLINIYDVNYNQQCVLPETSIYNTII